MNEDFEEVVSKESRRLYALCFRLTGNAFDAEDLCQEALAKAFKNFDRFEGRSQVSTWLYRIAMNTWKNNMSAKKRWSFFQFLPLGGSSDTDDQEGTLEPKGNDPAPEAEFEKRESNDLLQQALMNLSVDEREMIVLRDLEEKTYEEMGELLHIPLGTVKSRLARARDALRLTLAPILKAKGELR